METRHRVLFIAPRFHTNQIPIVRALKAQGHEVVYAVRWKRAQEDYEVLTPIALDDSLLTRGLDWLAHKKDNAFRYRLRFRWGMPSPKAVIDLMRAYNPTVVVIRDPLTLTGLFCLQIARLKRAVPIVYTQMPKYTLSPRPGLGAFAAWTRSAWYTPVLGTFSPKACFIGNLYYVPFVIEAQPDATSKPWFEKNRINILCVAKFEKRKGHALLYHALAQLADRYPLHLTVVADASTVERQQYYRWLEDLACHLKIAPLIEYRLNVPYREMGLLYRSHDLYVLPSYNEPASVSLLEAMAHGLPVICSDTNGTRCYIESGYNGYVFRSCDAVDLACKIESVIEERARLQRMGANSLRLVATRHRPENYVRALENLAAGRPVDENVFLALPN